MPMFEVAVWRTVKLNSTVEIEAADADEAKALAQSKADELSARDWIESDLIDVGVGRAKCIS